MITLRKIGTLKPSTRLRKCANVFRELGRSFASGKMVDMNYLEGLLEIILETDLPGNSDAGYIAKKKSQLHSVPDQGMVWFCDDIYYFLINLCLRIVR